MIMQIALGIFFGVLFLIAFALLIFIVSALISKADTIKTMKKYDFEEDEEDESDW